MPDDTAHLLPVQLTQALGATPAAILVRLRVRLRSAHHFDRLTLCMANAVTLPHERSQGMQTFPLSVWEGDVGKVCDDEKP